MTRPSAAVNGLLAGLLLASLVGLAGLGGVAGAPGAYADDGSGTTTQGSTQPTELTVSLLSLSPATLPRRGRITLTGTVTNSSTEVWQDINVLPIVSSTPITTRSELAQAQQTPADTGIGTRLTAPGTFVGVGDLAPGQSAPFRLSLPRSALPIPVTGAAPGVYWIGVHALGANTEGRDAVADGRARTFIPLVPAGVRGSVAFVVPVRSPVRHDAEGRLEDTDRWGGVLAPDGRLSRLLGVLSSAGTTPVSWLVDPAVLDAVQAVADDNPRIRLGSGTPTGGDPAGGDPGGDGAGEAKTSASRSASRISASAADRDDARDWLTRFTAAAGTASLLSLPYADPDVVALADQSPSLLATAGRLAAERLAARGLEATPAVAPPSGYLDPGSLGSLAAGTAVLVADHATPADPSPADETPEDPTGATQWSTSTGQTLSITDSLAADGGPSPGDALGALAERQRIVSDAALRALSSAASDKGAGPMVVQLPTRWDPGADWQQARFFTGLPQWLDVVSAVAPADAPAYSGELPYPASVQDREIGPGNVAAAQRLVRTGTVVSELLSSEQTAREALTAAALAATSYDAQARQTDARDEVRALDATIRSRLAGVRVVGTDFVTLSGNSGSLTVTLVNDLAQPVDVGLKVTTSDPEVSVQVPRRVSMGAGQRATLRLRASAREIGVHAVTVQPTTTEGQPVGTPLRFSLRTSEVGRLIWLVMVVAGLVLLVMIVRRVVVRIRTRRWRPVE